MSKVSALIWVLVCYKLLLLMIAWWASRQTKSKRDFFLAGQGLGPWVAAISASASTSSAWTLLGVSGVAYLWGLSVVWLLPGVLIGYVINWYFVAPRLHRLAREENHLTLTDVFARGHKQARFIAILCSVIILFSFSFYIAAQFQAAGTTFASNLGLDLNYSIVVSGVIILIYTFLGGFWAVSVTDTVQGILMALTALVLPLMALIYVGGFSGLGQALASQENATLLSLSGQFEGWLAFGFIAGSLGIGLANPGQPHVVSRFMALKDEPALRQARIISIAWAIIVFGGMIILGLCARAVFSEMNQSEQVFFLMTDTLLPTVLAGVVIAAVLSAIMSTADSQLLVCAAALSHDLDKRKDNASHSLSKSRLAVVLVTGLAIALAIFAPDSIFSRVLFAWTALGAAFGPLLIVRLLGHKVSQSATIAAIGLGFGLTVLLHLQPSPPGDYLERLLPFSLAFMIAWWGRQSPANASEDELTEMTLQTED